MDGFLKKSCNTLDSKRVEYQHSLGLGASSHGAPTTHGLTQGLSFNTMIDQPNIPKC